MMPHSIYRPAYHRIPSTPIRQSPFLSTEVTPIVVPSMSSPNYQPRHYSNMNYFQPPPPPPPSFVINHQPPAPLPQPIIHHTLENATITFDTIEPDFQKELVKDVFFSPAAMISPVREMSPLSTTSTLDEPFETPLFFEEESVFGLDFVKKPTLDLSTLNQAAVDFLPTPPASVHDKAPIKRRRHQSDEGSNKKQCVSTPPESPTPTDYFGQVPSDFEPSHFWESEEEEEEYVPKKHKKKTVAVESSPRPTAHPTIYQKLTKANIDWCRYCGTTEGVNWRPGPWGKRTLCNKHGCDYKGYGFACKLPRLDLTGFMHEKLHDRDRPVLQLFCSCCQRKESWQDNVLVRCEGCPKAYHQQCFENAAAVNTDKPWFCDESCCENARRKRIVVELTRKRLPLMRSPSRNSCT